jgi:hypothetical protein
MWEGNGLMYRKIGLAATGAALAVVAVAGCSAAKSVTKTASNVMLSPLDALQTALTTANKDNTVKVTGSVSASGVNMQMNGVEQFAPLEMSMNVTIDSAATGDMTMSEVYDGTTFYLKDPELASLDGGKPWAKYDLSGMGAAGSSAQSMLTSAKNETPTASLEPLLASGDLKSLGSATVDGQQTTHYAGTLTSAQIASLTARQGLTAAQAQQVKQLMQSGGIQSETIDVWIGSNNLPVQVKTVADASTGAASTTMVFSDWGAAAAITDPPADQVGTLTMPAAS